jgi:putative MATE family efflux protein
MADARPGAHDMTQGRIRAHITRMTLMMLLGMFLQTAYSLVDIYRVAQLGKEAVAAVALGSNLNFVTIAIAQMIGVGTVALVSQAAGRRDEAAVQRNFNQSQSLSIVAGVVFLATAFALRNPFAENLAGDAATSALAKRFLDWFIPALALQFSMIGLGSALRGVGDMKPGLIAQAASVLLNMVLAPFLIFGWVTGHPYGVAGAAMATFYATLAAVIGLALYLARTETYFRVRFADWLPDWRLWGRMLGIGLPAGAEFGLMTVLMLLIYAVIRPFGAEAQAGFGIGVRIMQAGFMPAIALSFAVAAVAGQNFGARAFPRVRETFREGAKMNVAFMLFFTALCQVAPASLMRLFSQDPAVVDVGAEYLHVISFNYVAFGLVVVAGGMFQGMGNTWPSLLASAIRVTGFIAIVVWLSHQLAFQIVQVWVISVFTVLVQMVLALALLRREFGRRLGPPAGSTAAAAAT